MIMAGGGGGDPPDRGKNNFYNVGNKMATENRESYMYVARDAPPYRVYVEILDNQKRINKFSVGVLLRKVEKCRNHITELKYLGKNKIIVFLNSWIKANLLVEDTFLKENGYKAFIPRHLVSITGVIGGVPLDIDTEEMLQDIECAYPVLSLYRLNRWDREKSQKVPSEIIRREFWKT
jgi:hypothetical protein